MDKLVYISKQLSRALPKKYEHYVVSRIWHLLNDLDIKFVTQQYVTRPEGRALTDMYFPQLKIHIEVDEGHHQRQIDWDLAREKDIINATGHEIFRVDVTKDINSINNQIDTIISTLKTQKEKIKNFKKWDLEAEQNPQTYINQEYMRVDDDVAFKYSFEAANCFGHSLESVLRKSSINHKFEPKKIWFPKLYKNNGWINIISDDEEQITVESTSELINQDHYKREMDFAVNVLVFARVISPLGDVMYRFKGEYELDREKSEKTKIITWKRVATEVKTYPPKLKSK